jgi:hypothetical protein
MPTYGEPRPSKLRGRGANAPEKELGADGIFQIEVLDLDGQYIVRKGLLSQSKIGWTGRDGRLFEQARNLLRQSESAIVIDYSPHGYRAIPARDVIIARETGNGYHARTTNPSPRFWATNLWAAGAETGAFIGIRRMSASLYVARRHPNCSQNSSS